MTERARFSRLVASASDPRPLGLRALFDAHYGPIWRLLRRLGVRPERLDDAAQEVFWVAARRLGDIVPGREGSFLYGVALRVASGEGRRQAAIVPLAALEDAPPLVDGRPLPDDELDRRRARALLDEVLEGMPQELRAVLVLAELEGLEIRAIAALQGIPAGTASSRLRRAREEFAAVAKRVRARRGLQGGRG